MCSPLSRALDSLYVEKYPVHVAIAANAFNILISAPFFKLAFPNTSLVRFDAQIKSIRLFLPTTPPLLPAPKSNQALPTNLIPTLQQRRYIHIKRTVHFRVREQLMDSLQRRRERVRRRPRRLQEVEADFASLEIYIGVADGR